MVPPSNQQITLDLGGRDRPAGRGGMQECGGPPASKPMHHSFGKARGRIGTQCNIGYCQAPRLRALRVQPARPPPPGRGYAGVELLNEPMLEARNPLARDPPKIRTRWVYSPWSLIFPQNSEPPLLLLGWLEKKAASHPPAPDPIHS